MVGDVVTDVVALLGEPLVHGSDAAGSVRMMAGGAGGNVAAWLAHLGVPVTVLGRVGDDDAGRRHTAELAAAGVVTALSVDPDRPTGTVVVLVGSDGERTMVADRGANRGLLPTDVLPGLLVAGDHLHLSAYPLLDPASTETALHALRAAASAGMTVSVDPSSVQPLRNFGVDRFRTETTGIDLLLPNAEEAMLIAGVDDAAAAARLLAETCPTVVVSRGASGAAWAQGTRHGSVAAAPGPVLDTTGAGDAFTAGVLRAWLGGLPVARCAADGAGVAATAVAVRGGRPAG